MLQSSDRHELQLLVRNGWVEKWVHTEWLHLQKFRSKRHTQIKHILRSWYDDGKMMKKLPWKGRVVLPPVERGSRLGKAHGLLRKCCFFDLSVIPVVPTSSLVCEFFFFYLVHFSACMRVVTIRTGKQDSASHSTGCSGIWFGVGFICFGGKEWKHTLTYTWESSGKVNNLLSLPVGLRV